MKRMIFVVLDIILGVMLGVWMSSLIWRAAGVTSSTDFPFSALVVTICLTFLVVIEFQLVKSESQDDKWARYMGYLASTAGGFVLAWVAYGVVAVLAGYTIEDALTHKIRALSVSVAGACLGLYVAVRRTQLDSENP